MPENTVRLGKYELLKYSFGSFLSCTDVATDILTAIIYLINQQKHFVWFGFCPFFALLPSFLLTLAFLLQRCGQETICTLLKRFLFFANPCGSGILKFKLELLCLFTKLWWSLHPRGISCQWRAAATRLQSGESVPLYRRPVRKHASNNTSDLRHDNPRWKDFSCTNVFNFSDICKPCLGSHSFSIW